MARLPYVDPETAPEAVRKLMGKLKVQLNIFRMAAHAETGLRPLLRLGSSILVEQLLDDKLRELAILRVAEMSHARYEWVQHVPIAQGVGATEAQVQALDRGDIEAGCFDDDERLVLRFTTEVVRDVGASDETFAAMAGRFSPREIVELILAVGYYMMMARLMETTRLDVDGPVGMAVIDSARQNRGAR